MPTNEFPEQVSVRLVEGTRDKLHALAMQRGDSRSYNAIVRYFIKQGMDRMIAGLDNVEKAEYESILANEKLATSLELQVLKDPGFDPPEYPEEL